MKIMFVVLLFSLGAWSASAKKMTESERLDKITNIVKKYLDLPDGHYFDLVEPVGTCVVVDSDAKDTSVPEDTDGESDLLEFIPYTDDGISLVTLRLGERIIFPNINRLTSISGMTQDRTGKRFRKIEGSEGLVETEKTRGCEYTVKSSMKKHFLLRTETAKCKDKKKSFVGENSLAWDPSTKLLTYRYSRKSEADPNQNFEKVCKFEQGEPAIEN